ncbi:MAG TPA: hypothetical protein VF058_11620 [Actinomycetota bacterium]
MAPRLKHRLDDVVRALVTPRAEPGALPLVDAAAGFRPGDRSAVSSSSAFLLALAGSDDAAVHLSAAAEGGDAVAAFLADGLRRIDEELDGLGDRDAALAERMGALAAFLEREDAGSSVDELAERIWAVFFPEGVGIRGHEEARAAELRARRAIDITERGPAVTDAARQVLFTVNLLLTGPPAGVEVDDLDLPSEITGALRDPGPQAFWYDHPVQIGIDAPSSELRYGLAAMDRGMAFERERGADRPLRVVVSLSTTHERLQEIARPYLEHEVREMGGLEHLELYAFGEADAERLVAKVLAPAAEAFLDRPHARELLGVLGVRGPYGRHHSFGKAIAAVWHVLIDPEVVATFKTDLDHSWPQDELVSETGASLLEHFAFPLWGGTGIDAEGRRVELGGFAAALVNEADIDQGLFTTDVPVPDRSPEANELLFWSALPQGLSTLAEASTRYGIDGPDGVTTAIERVHVHAGTVGILVEALRRHRPFTPSFIGRAEDQAYILSTLWGSEPRLAHVHHRELIQRHDKKAFADAAIEAARVGTWVGDHERLVLFSELARHLGPGRDEVKTVAGPFTGAFISQIPATVTLLRLTLKAGVLAAKGAGDEAEELLAMAAERLGRTLAFVEGGELAERLDAERRGWDLLYETLGELERRLAAGDAEAERLADRARRVVAACAVG